jgi:AbrB family looped-hinge helix DNA binding protein
MIPSIDSAGRIVLPKPLRERAGLVPGDEIRVEFDGGSTRAQVESGQGLECEGRFLVIPASGHGLDAETVDELRRSGQH